MLYDLRKPVYQVGDVVITSKGFKFEATEISQAGQSWKDLETGLIWRPDEPGQYTHKEAVDHFGDKLPTKQEFELAEKHGFREVCEFKRTSYWSGTWDWSSTVGESDHLAYVMDGAIGVTLTRYRGTANVSVCCVVRT